MRDVRSIAAMVIFAIVMFWQLGSLNISIMEARNFVTAREMIADGSYLIPTLNGEYRLQKPPLPTWLTAGVGWLTDMKSLFWLRFPAAIMGLVALFYSMRIFRLISGEAKDFILTGFILLTSFYFIFSARSGMWDIYAQAFMLGGIYHYMMVMAATKSSRRPFIHALVFGLFMAASFMSKGPVALYALFLPFLMVFHILHPKSILGRKNAFTAIGLGVVVAVVLSILWPAYIYFSDAGQTAAEVISKESGNWTSYNVRPFYYYWSFPTQSGVWTIIGTATLILFGSYYNRLKKEKDTALYFWWVVGIVVLLSVIPEKKSRYLLPVIFPLAMLISTSVQRVDFKKNKVILLFCSALTAAAVGAISFIIFGRDYEIVASSIVKWLGGLSILFTACLTTYFSFKRELVRAIYAISFSVILFILFFIAGVGDMMNSKNAVRSFESFQRDAALAEIPLFSSVEVRPELLWYIGRKTPKITMDDIPTDLEKIGIFSFDRIETEWGTGFFDDWELVSVKRFDQNPKVSEKKPNIALRRYFTILKKRKE